MRHFLIILILAVTSLGVSNPVLDRLDGNVIGTATNERGTVFVELDVAPDNLLQAMESLESGSLAVITVDGTVVYGWRLSPSRLVTQSLPWLEFAQTNGRSESTMFGMKRLAYDSEGNFLNRARIEADRVAVIVGGPGNRTGCTSSTGPYRSDLQCYENGRLVYEIVCTSNNVDYQVTCRTRGR